MRALVLVNGAALAVSSLNNKDTDTMTDLTTPARPEATDRRCTICGAGVAAWPNVMVCHCYEMPWPIDPALSRPSLEPSDADVKLVATAIARASTGKGEKWSQWLREARAAIAALQPVDDR